ncbi:MAG: AAA family ATPase [Bacteroidota bacterium]
MKNTLLEYLNKRMHHKKPEPQHHFERPPGPVITISREVGCSGIAIAKDLADRLIKKFPGREWKVLSKEIFAESARELDLEPERVSRIFKQIDRTTFDEMINAFNEKKYKSDRKVRKTVVEVIRSFAEDGYCIIVGRASNIIAGDLKNALHVRVVAPMEYRIRSIMEKDKVNRHNAIAFIEKVEKERYAYRHAVMGKGQNEPEIFDITFNSEAFCREMMIDIIMLAIDEKKIMADYLNEIGKE